MGKIIFILGGAGSGKSKFALQMAKKGKNVAFVATCDSKDREMKRKIDAHREERPSHWHTLEAGSTPFELAWPNGKTDCLVIDSLTLWVSELMRREMSPEEILRKCDICLEEARKRFKSTVVVSDEVGLGIVPENRLAREFREVLGQVNQQTAQLAGLVFLVTAGLPIQIKGKEKI